jgi:hypothetical protein
MVGEMSGGTNVGRTNVGRTNVGRTNVGRTNVGGTKVTTPYKPLLASSTSNLFQPF